MGNFVPYVLGFVAISIDKNVFEFFRLIFLVIHICIASGAKLSFASVSDFPAKQKFCLLIHNFQIVSILTKKIHHKLSFKVIYIFFKS